MRLCAFFFSYIKHDTCVRNHAILNMVALFTVLMVNEGVHSELIAVPFSPIFVAEYVTDPHPNMVMKLDIMGKITSSVRVRLGVNMCAHVQRIRCTISQCVSHNARQL